MANVSPEAVAAYWNAIFDAVSAAMVHGPTLHLPSENLWFPLVRPGMLVSNRVPRDGVHCVCAAEVLPFPDATFSCVVGFDVLGRSPRPAHVLMEAERVLAPGGRLVLVEPWTGVVGSLWHRLRKHRRVSADLDPWFHNGAGTAAAARTCLVDRADELPRHAPSLALRAVTPLGGLGEVLAGQFGADAARVERHMARLARLQTHWPAGVGRLTQSVLATRALCVLDRLGVPEE